MKLQKKSLEAPKAWNPVLQFGKVLLFIFYGLLEIHKQIWKGQENQQYISNDPNL